MYDPAGLGISLVNRQRIGSLRVWRFTGMMIHEPEDSLETQCVFQMDDKAQGPAGRFMLMVGRFKRKGMRNIFLKRKQDPNLYLACIRR